LTNKRFYIIRFNGKEVVSGVRLQAWKRHWNAAGVNHATALSDTSIVDFGKNYDCLIKGRRDFRRAVLIIDRKNNVNDTFRKPTFSVGSAFEEIRALTKAALAR
jgi:hypothetical protein